MFKELLVNLRAGAGLTLPRAVAPGAFRSGGDQAILLAAIALAVPFCADLYWSLPAPAFNDYALGEAAVTATLLLIALHLALRSAGGGDYCLALVATLAGALPPLLLFQLLQPLARELPQHLQLLANIIAGAWIAIILFRALRLASGASLLRSTLALLLLLLLWALPCLWYRTGEAFWYPQEEEPQPIDAEAAFYAQPALMDRALLSLQPQRPGVTDIYFVAMAGWADQAVFIKEASYARALFDQRFGSAGRSLLLANHPSTVDSLPLATETNLRAALTYLGRIIDPQEDLVILFLTSHGSPDAFAIDFWPLPLNPLTPERLRRHLDDAAIRWRAIFVSSCYSGSFIPPLADDRTLIATASAADRQSFGCESSNDFTYFGEALLQEQLAHGQPLVAAVEGARRAIAAREEREGLEPSLPQFVVGEGMRRKLEGLERLRHTGSE